MALVFADYLISANAILALLLCLTVAFSLASLWHQSRFEAERKITRFVLLTALAAFSVSAIAFFLMYYLISNDRNAMVLAALSLSVALASLLVAYRHSFKRSVSAYVDENGRPIKKEGKKSGEKRGKTAGKKRK